MSAPVRLNQTEEYKALSEVLARKQKQDKICNIIDIVASFLLAIAISLIGMCVGISFAKQAYDKGYYTGLEEMEDNICSDLGADGIYECWEIIDEIHVN